MDGATPPGRSDRGLRARGPRSWPGIVILSAWLLGWGYGELQAVRRLFFSDEPGGAWFLALWLVTWTAGGLLALRALLRLLAGREPPAPPPPPGPRDPPGTTDAG